jgi:hypothetical protein
MLLNWLGIQPSPTKKSKISDERKETQKKYEVEK